MISADRYRVLARGVRLRKAWRALDDLAESAAGRAPSGPAGSTPSGPPKPGGYSEARVDSHEATLAEQLKLLSAIAHDLSESRDSVLHAAGTDLRMMVDQQRLVPELLSRCARDLRIALGDLIRDRDGSPEWHPEGGPQAAPPPRVPNSPGMLYLDGIRAPWNVGALFRAAEAFGVSRVVLGPDSASPEHPRARRAAAGTVERIAWEIDTLEGLLVRLGRGTVPEGPLLDVGKGEPNPWEKRVFALESGGKPLEGLELPVPGIMVLGHEELGVSPAALRVAEAGLGRVTIAFPGAKGSLNVSVAAGIALYAWSRQAQFRMTS